VNISIFGLGYVGVVSAGCLAAQGHRVIGVDTNRVKVDLINDGKSPIIEKDIEVRLRDAVEAGRLSATLDPSEAIQESEITFICVGTPSSPNGSLDVSHVRTVCEEIGTCLRQKEAFHIVVLRSTVLPGTVREHVIPTLENSSGKRAGIDFGVCNNPEFLREGTAVEDYYNPPKTVIGQSDDKSGGTVAKIYEELPGPLIKTTIEVAEMVKYVDNVWHALKVSFGNEIGNICKSLGIDSHKVMDIFVQDTKLNLSSYYLKPGFAFGGSCLPKDVRALSYCARTLDLDVPVLEAILPSNRRQIEKALAMISNAGSKKVGVLGFSFKAGTDDLRESPIVEVIERLIGKGYDVKLYDENVSMARLAGANRDFILNHIPHISGLMVDSLEAVLVHADLLVIGNKADEFINVPERLRPNQKLIDLVRITQDIESSSQYEGICW